MVHCVMFFPDNEATPLLSPKSPSNHESTKSHPTSNTDTHKKHVATPPQACTAVLCTPASSVPWHKNCAMWKGFCKAGELWKRNRFGHKTLLYLFTFLFKMCNPFPHPQHTVHSKSFPVLKHFYYLIVSHLVLNTHIHNTSTLVILFFIKN